MPTRQPLLTLREAALTLGISCPTIKRWIYNNKIKSIRTAGGHHRIPETELARVVPRAESGAVRDSMRRVSGRNQLVGRIIEIRRSGLLAQIRLSVGGQQITAIITADAANAIAPEEG